MGAVQIACLVFGLLGVAFGVRCYFELWKWARQCQNARIAIAHKQKVQLVGTLVEWLTWANQLDKDQSVKGRVVYRNGHVSVSILRPLSKQRIRNSVKRVYNARSKTKAAA